MGRDSGFGLIAMVLAAAIVMAMAYVVLKTYFTPGFVSPQVRELVEESEIKAGGSTAGVGYVNIVGATADKIGEIEDKRQQDIETMIKTLQ